MKELEAGAEIFRFEHFGGDEEFGGAEAELRIFAAALGPTSGALAQQTGANADERLDIELFRDGNNLPKLFELFDNHDDFFAELGAEQRHFDEARILVAVANDKAAHLALKRQTSEQFRFAA